MVSGIRVYRQARDRNETEEDKDKLELRVSKERKQLNPPSLPEDQPTDRSAWASQP